VNVDGAGVKVCVIPSESANLPEPSRSTPSPLTLPVARDPLPQPSPQDEIHEGAGTGCSAVEPVPGGDLILSFGGSSRGGLGRGMPGAGALGRETAAQLGARRE